jgi:hypothetical protein
MFYEIIKWPDNVDKIELNISVYEHENDILREKLKEIVILDKEKSIFEMNCTSLFL